ncbi:MAG: SpoIID/LytB domain-containing protein [Muribaculaceae bacterium]|nr:SpoIID/LytB domain-containing protein [Muribaculaceae bacterium]
MKLLRALSLYASVLLLSSCRGGSRQVGTVPMISVGLMTVPEVTLVINDSASSVSDTLRIATCDVDSCMTLSAPAGGVIEIVDVTIGVGFHWEQQETQAFEGDIKLLRKGDQLVVINEIDIERYLESVISSEMSANSSEALLKAHAVISRSWLLSQLERRGRKAEVRAELPGEVTVWYDRDDHDLFDVCADDHCQRYQGVTRRTNPAVADAVKSTRGLVLTSGGEVCDARFSKCCGGVTEEFENCWEPVHKSYLEACCDSPEPLPVPDLTDSTIAAEWIESRPDAFCANPSTDVLAAVLNSYDRATTDFYRWTVIYRADSLGALFERRTGRHLGYIRDLRPLQRGKSGRITRLMVVGSEDSLIIGKELEIRRSLSPTHLYSSAFTVAIDGDDSDAVITLHGAGWGHGVGLCQIGAAVMGSQGYSYEDILSHYFPGSNLTLLYQ